MLGHVALRQCSRRSSPCGRTALYRLPRSQCTCERGRGSVIGAFMSSHFTKIHQVERGIRELYTATGIVRRDRNDSVVAHRTHHAHGALSCIESKLQNLSDKAPDGSYRKSVHCVYNRRCSWLAIAMMMGSCYVPDGARVIVREMCATR